MVTATDPCADWLAGARIPADRLSPEQHAVLRAASRFRQRCGSDYYSTRLLGHFLLHCECGLSVTQIARLVGVSRPTASRQQGLSSKEAIQQAHHRMDGRPYGKLLPRYAGPIVEFLLTRPDATRADLIDFIDHTFGIRVARVALYKFLNKYGLQPSPSPAPAPAPAAGRPVCATDRPAGVTPVGPALLPPPLPAAVPVVPQGQPIPTPAPPFSAPGRSTPAPSC